MSDEEFRERMVAALAPLVAFIADNMAVIEQATNAYDAWGINRLEALANGYIDEAWRA